MSVIYKPKGAAKEYSEFATNTCKKCTFGCIYCYGPSVMRMKKAEFHSGSGIKFDFVNRFRKDAEKYKNLGESFLMNFIGDPYMNDEVAKITHDILLICEENGFQNVNILTKGGLKATNDFELLQRNNWKFGQTIVFWDDFVRQEYEPKASSIESRYAALKLASSIDLYTWVSLEPIIIASEALKVIANTKDCVDFWKIGKINHFPKLEIETDWKSLLKEIKSLLPNNNYLIKESLKKYEN